MIIAAFSLDGVWEPLCYCELPGEELEVTVPLGKSVRGRFVLVKLISNKRRNSIITAEFVGLYGMSIESPVGSPFMTADFEGVVEEHPPAPVAAPAVATGRSQVFEDTLQTFPALEIVGKLPSECYDLHQVTSERHFTR